MGPQPGLSQAKWDLGSLWSEEADCFEMPSMSPSSLGSLLHLQDEIIRNLEVIFYLQKSDREPNAWRVIFNVIILLLIIYYQECLLTIDDLTTNGSSFTMLY